jgi:hypothetical protein
MEPSDLVSFERHLGHLLIGKLLVQTMQSSTCCIYHRHARVKGRSHLVVKQNSCASSLCAYMYYQEWATEDYEAREHSLVNKHNDNQTLTVVTLVSNIVTCCA